MTETKITGMQQRLYTTCSIGSGLQFLSNCQLDMNGTLIERNLSLFFCWKFSMSYMELKFKAGWKCSSWTIIQQKIPYSLETHAFKLQLTWKKF